MSWTALYMAGFEVTLHGRFWVITEGREKNLVERRDKRTHLTPTAVLMEGDYAH